MTTKAPIVDLSPWYSNDKKARRQLCRQIRQLCHEIGFFYVVNHGIPTPVTQSYLSMLKAFFALPVASKQLIDKHKSPQFRGWEKLGSELTNNQIDYREQIDIGIDREAISCPEPYYMALIGPNQWPAESLIPGFKGVVNDYFRRLTELARQMLRIMSLALGLNEDHIEQVFGENPSPYLKLIRYPAAESGEQGVGVHKDSGFLTLLLQDVGAGLEAQANDNSWYQVDPIPGSLVVNTGELLQLVTQNYFIATPHRVVNRDGQERYSSAFFYSPDLNTMLDPLPVDRHCLASVKASERHRNEGLMASRAEMVAGKAGMASPVRSGYFGERYWNRWVRSYPDIARRYYADLVE